jgi:hypothetical protein
MRTKVILALALIAGVLVLAISVLRPAKPAVSAAPDQSGVAAGATLPASPPTARRKGRTSHSPARWTRDAAQPPAPSPAASLSKLDRLEELRATFRALAGGDPAAALRAAKALADPTERETALLTLATVWTGGELSPPRVRAIAIATYGLEAGLGLELARFPELAVLWASELVEGEGRTAILQQTAAYLLNSDPASAFAVRDLLPA